MLPREPELGLALVRQLISIGVLTVSVADQSDVSGVGYEPFDVGGAWRFKLGKELQAAGYDVDLNKL